jgi:hypothetical protein
MQKFYLVFGMTLLSLFGIAQYRGWSFTSYDELKGVPKSIRNNPGSYRSFYHYRYFHK